MTAPTAASHRLAAEKKDERGWIRVWDPLIRLFHWCFAGAIIAAYVSSDARTLHESAGYVALALVFLRIVWGLTGPRYARFSNFVRGPRATFAYLGDIFAMRARRYLGHNPAGSAMILALLILAVVTGVSGWLSTTDYFFAVHWMEELHSLSASLLIACAGLHVVGVVASSVLHRENLARAMITGKKRS